MSETITPANVVLLTLQVLMDDVDLDELFEHAGIPIERLLDPEGVLTSSDIVRVTESARILTDDPALGLHLGEEFGVEMLDMVGMLMTTAPTLGAGLQEMLRYSPLLTSMGRGELVEDGDGARVVLHMVDDMAPILAFCVELAAAAFWNIARRIVKGDFRLHRVNLAQPAPPWADQYPQVFGEEVEFVFDAPENSVVFDRAALDLPMVRHSPGLYGRLQEQAARRLASRPQAESASASVLRLIDEHLGERVLDLPTVAGYMGLTPRTLQRRLKDESTSFQSLYDSRRQQVAQDQLQRDTDTETIAAMLGYSDPANFYRAFKAWTGVSPSEFRKRRSA
jgi:AraC-like DNA-binding protein